MATVQRYEFQTNQEFLDHVWKVHGFGPGGTSLRPSVNHHVFLHTVKRHEQNHDHDDSFAVYASAEENDG